MALRKELGISENTFILFYHGSLGTWYLGEKMLDFYENLLKTKPDSVFLLVVNDFPVSLQKSVQQRGLGDKIILRQKLPRQRIPLYLSLANLCIMFIKPVFSKTASSPIKYAESLAMNKPVLANIGVGDMAELADNDWGFLVKQLTQSEYQDAIRALSAFNNRQIRRQSKSSYLLSSGVEKYDDVYAKTCKVLL
ncbi:MAG: hypothetical protein C0592_07660 [Marinilabiliales bacterium]|nr:MAG: hypothetical protein C0592_07660 [Marinilabiliales bacterium]